VAESDDILWKAIKAHIPLVMEGKKQEANINTTNTQMKVANLDHLGIIDEMGIVDEINARVGRNSREKVSAGVIVKAMILNGLGFVSAPLYMFRNEK